MLSFDDAFSRLLSNAQPVARIQSCATLHAHGKILAKTVSSTLDVPPLDNSQMDGYAVRSAEFNEIFVNQAQQTHSFSVSQRIPAGQMPGALQPGTVARIFTGAPMPKGADAVVMQEAAQVNSDGSVVFSEGVKSGQWVRRRAEDIAIGSQVLLAGEKLSPQACGLVASIGCEQVMVYDTVRVACFFTGDELVMPGQPLPAGAIYNSNRFVLRGLLEQLGCEVVDLGIVPDSLEATRSALREAAKTADLIITSGGMSVGEEDHIKPALQAEGSLDMWQMAIKPGKPLAYGTVRRAQAVGAMDATLQPCHFIGLPGNPVSAFVTFLLLARPFIAKLQGRSEWAVQARPVRADFSWPKPDKRREFLRVRVNAQGGLDLFPNQGSGVLTSTVWAQGLVDNPAGKSIAAGDFVNFLSYADMY